MYAWRTKAAIAVNIRPNITAYFSQMRLIGIKYTREIYTDIDHTYYVILENDELRDKQRRHILEIAIQPEDIPGITIERLNETEFRARIEEITPHLFSDWGYNGPVVESVTHTETEIVVTFDVDMQTTPSLDGWSFSVNDGIAPIEEFEFESVIRNTENAKQYIFTIAEDDIPDWNTVVDVTISYNCFAGTTTSLAGVRLGFLNAIPVALV